jgi:predicted metal-dependent hydrolase
MLKNQRSHNIDGIEFKVIYSGRRSIGISVLPDSSVIVRAPNLSSLKTIDMIIKQKADWIIKHRDSYKQRGNKRLNGLYVSGEIHLFRGKEYALQIEKTNRPYIRFSDHTIELGLDKTDDLLAVKSLLYKGYKSEAFKVFPELLSMILKELEYQAFKPTGLVIRSMKSRWGSCSKKGTITLSTELIKLPDKYLEYVIIHELCHLKHHNHGKEFYGLLSELFPDWKQLRKDLRGYIM